MADACVVRLIEKGRAAIIAIVHVDDIFICRWTENQARDRFRDELNHLVPAKNMGELRWFEGSHYSRDRERGTLTISKKMLANDLVRKIQVIFEQSVPLRSSRLRLEKNDDEEKVENWPLLL